ncbi:MAG: T9SS type A sorting domain-containing protein, partial [Bacteroidota bacterium]
SNLLTTARDYVGDTEVGSASNTVSVSATLPVMLLSFTAGWLNDHDVKLSWVTARETNTSDFEIEKSNGTMPFEKIGQVAAAGVSSSAHPYYFIDSFPAAGSNQYRLKMIDRDSRHTYSPIILLNKKQTGLDIQKSFPNPFTSELNVQLLSDKTQPIQLLLSDMSGKMIYSRDVVCNNGINNIILDQLSSLQAGIYLLRVNTSTEKLQQKLVKIR